MQPFNSELTVTELLNRCCKRPPDEEAWQEFVRRYNTTIKSNVIKTFHRKSREEADRRMQFPEDLIDDLIQAVYTKLVEERNKALERFEGEYANSIYQYLGMISVNVVRDYFREIKAQKRPKVSYSLDQLLESTGDAALLNETVSRLDGRPAVPGSEGSFTTEEIERALKRAITGRNRDRDLLIFKLRYIEGLTLEEITRVMGLGLSAISVGSILNRVIKRVKQTLESGRS
jgi:RNA polymerase sigma factor (sigma-70 family)